MTRLLQVFVQLCAVVVASSASAQSFIEYPIPSPAAIPEAIALGPDGAVWFVEADANKVARITTSGTITEFSIPTASSVTFSGITAGPDGAVWFTELTANKIGRVTTSGAMTEFAIPTAASNPEAIVTGPDGNLWFAEGTGNKIGRLTPAGVFTEFTIPTAASTPIGITLGPDANLWFTEYDKGKIGKITAAGSITEFTLPNAASGPNQIRTGPDGNLWFTEDRGAKIGRISTSGAVAEFPVPGTTALRGIDFGSDGNVYFVEVLQSKIGRMTTSGVLTEFDTPSPATFPTFLTRGADGNLWFGEVNANKIAVLVLPKNAILPAVASTAGSLGSFFRTGVQLHNPTPSAISGKIVFHPAGHSSGDGDAPLPYSLNAGETKNIADLLPAMGQVGLGSADVFASSGPLPTVVARVFNDGGAAGTAGFTEDMVKPENALAAGDQFVIIVPADLARFRLNIGVRSLTGGASITITERNAAGTVVRTNTKSYLPTFFEQTDAASFLGGAPAANDSIAVRVDAGSLLVYGASTDNITQDPSIQLGHK